MIGVAQTWTKLLLEYKHAYYEIKSGTEKDAEAYSDSRTEVTKTGNVS